MIPRLGRREFERIATGVGLPLADFGSLEPVQSTVLAIMDPLATTDHDRHRVPSPAAVDRPLLDDPLNAFVRRCDVPRRDPAF